MEGIGPHCIPGYVIRKPIGRGGFGTVYEAMCADGQACALKVGSRESISREIQAYLHLQGCEFIPVLLGHGVLGDVAFLALPLFRHSLRDVLESRLLGRRLATTIARKLLQTAEFIHNRGMMYRDFKPENVMISHSNRVFLVDFGMCRRFIRDDGTHVAEEHAGMSGTVWYASTNAHRGMQQSRRDDLESLFYLIVLLYRSRLPWMDTQMDRAMIGHAKESLSADSLCSGVAGKQHLVEFVQYIKRLRFEEAPDYTYLDGLLSCIHGIARRVAVPGTASVVSVSLWTKMISMLGRFLE